MKKMNIEKIVELNQEFESVHGIECHCHLDYVASEAGIRAYGILKVEGFGVRNGLNHPIAEEIELDIFAPYEKIEHSQSFHVTLEQSKAELVNDHLVLSIEFVVSGLKEEEDIEGELIEDMDVFEDLLDDTINKKEVERYVIAQKQDTYQSIAERYHVSEKELITKNQNKVIEYKSLVLLPDGLD